LAWIETVSGPCPGVPAGIPVAALERCGSEALQEPSGQDWLHRHGVGRATVSTAQVAEMARVCGIGRGREPEGSLAAVD
jgi:hypothetical protein